MHNASNLLGECRSCGESGRAVAGDEIRRRGFGSVLPRPAQFTFDSLAPNQSATTRRVVNNVRNVPRVPVETIAQRSRNSDRPNSIPATRSAPDGNVSKCRKSAVFFLQFCAFFFLCHLCRNCSANVVCIVVCFVSVILRCWLRNCVKKIVYIFISGCYRAVMKSVRLLEYFGVIRLTHFHSRKKSRFFPPSNS